MRSPLRSCLPSLQRHYATRYLESVADETAFDNIPTLPGKAAIAFREDDGTLRLRSPAGVEQFLAAAITAGFKVAAGQETITPGTAATATVVTGLSTVVAVVASLDSDPDGDNIAAVSATIGDQAGTPAAGSVILKTWKFNGASDVTMVAATAATPYDVNWIAIGT